jgi:hypothetical protein
MQIKSGIIFLRSINVSTKPDGCFPLFAAIRQPSRLQTGRTPYFRFNRGYAEQVNKAGLFAESIFYKLKT